MSGVFTKFSIYSYILFIQYYHIFEPIRVLMTLFITPVMCNSNLLRAKTQENLARLEDLCIK